MALSESLIPGFESFLAVFHVDVPKKNCRRIMNQRSLGQNHDVALMQRFIIPSCMVASQKASLQVRVQTHVKVSVQIESHHEVVLLVPGP